MVEARKKKKHIQTAPAPRKAKREDGGAAFAVSRHWVEAAPSRMVRSNITDESASRATTPEANAAVRHPEKAAMPVTNTGAAAHPRLPARPCAENACPSMACETRRFRTVKSAGWNTAFPAPARSAATRSAG